jgi:uncharacterized protein
MKSLPRSIFIFLLMSGTWAWAESIPERPSHYITDLASVIDPGVVRRLSGYLQELEQKTGAQVLVLTVKSLAGESIDQFSLTVAEKWKLGRKGKDDGLLLLVSVEDRRYRFEVGYGLESILPDSLVGSIGRDNLLPNFKKGNYTQGIGAAVLALATVIANDRNVKITGMPKRREAPRQRSLFSLLASVVMGIVMLFLLIRYPRLLLLFLLLGGGGWRGGGGFSGGGFGSFGGGGGGGFGGGGASGSW